MQNILKEYHAKREHDWPTIETLKHFPVHFGLIDSIYSADGQLGVITDPNPNRIKTSFGGENLIAVDWVGARKIGLDPDDPKVGRFLPLAVEAFGKPEIVWLGDNQSIPPGKTPVPLLSTLLISWKKLTPIAIGGLPASRLWTNILFSRIEPGPFCYYAES